MKPPHLENGALTADVIEDKSGRSAIRARVFIDASGDADMAHSLGLTHPVKRLLQPPILLAKINWEMTSEGVNIQALLNPDRPGMILKYLNGVRVIRNDHGFAEEKAGVMCQAP